MKAISLGLATLVFSLTGLNADTLAVFGKNQISAINENGSITSISDSDAQRDFLHALNDLHRQGKYDAEGAIVAPPEWGKAVPGAAGTVAYQNVFPQGFATHLALHGLAPDHLYLLTLNGTPTTAGNNLLPDPVPNLPKERFYDFLRVATDAQGRYEADLGVYLLPGNYHVRIYVKDTKDFKIVLYRDYFDFTVTAQPGATAK